MSIPAWILDIFAAVMLLVAAVSAGQLVVARAWTRAGARDADIAISHLLMGIAMAGMLVAGLATLANGAWVAVFAVMTAWFGWCLRQDSRGHGAGAAVRGHHAPHLVHSAAMLYMFAALAVPATAGPALAGPAGGDGVVATMPRAAQAEAAVPEPAAAEPAAERLLLAPAVVKGCQVAMGVTMAFMLIIMI
jgi:Domain of unknown function (DUF5134)